MPLSSSIHAPPANRNLTRRKIARLAAAVVVLNLLLASALYMVVQQRTMLLDDKATTTARNLARVLQENLQGSISKIDLALLSVADEVGHMQERGPIKKAALNAYLAQMKNRIVEADSLRVTDAHGLIRYGVTEGSQELTSIADREHFQQLRDHPSLGLIMTEPLFGKISKKWVVVFARRLNTPDGRFAGLVSAAIPVEYLSHTFGTLDVGKHGLVVLRNNTLQVIVRYPTAPTPNIGKSVRLPALEKLHREGANEGIYRGTSPVDGIERIYAYSRIPANGLNLSVGLAKIDYLAELEEDKAYLVFACLLSLLLSWFGAILIYRSWLRKEEAQLARHIQAERMHAFANVSSDWFWEQDEHFRFSWFSESMRSKSGFDPQTLLGRPCWEVAHQLDETELACIKGMLQRQQAIRDWHLPMLSKNGELHYFSLSGDPIFDQAGVFLGYLGSGKDVTANVRIEQHLRHMAHHDPLTGLPNRTLFDDRVEQALLGAQRSKSRLALMYIDLDKFKPVNDAHGHSTGDALLVAVAQRMRETVRTSDTVSRVGGDEFMVLLPDIEDGASVMNVSEKLRSALNMPFVIGGRSLHISSSIGVVIYPEHGTTAEALARRADAAMYQAKQNGRDAVATFNPVPVEDASA